jgi:hypothetical protein
MFLLSLGALIWQPCHELFSHVLGTTGAWLLTLPLLQNQKRTMLTKNSYVFQLLGNGGRRPEASEKSPAPDISLVLTHVLTWDLAGVPAHRK